MTGRILGNNGILLTSSQEFKEQLANNLFRLVSVGRAPITSRTITSPPGSVSPDSYYIVPSGATGAWANKTNQIAYPVLGVNGQPVSGSWAFWVPFTGLKVALVDGVELVFNGTQWENFAEAADMRKAVYDTDDDGIVDQAEAISGNPGDNTFYGKVSGNKGFFDIFDRVRATVLTGLTTGTNTAITATDTLLGALQKLQAQINKFSNTDFISGQIELASNKTYVLDQSVKRAYTIKDISIISASGTVTGAIQISGTNVTGLSSLSISSTQANATASEANIASLGNRVTLALSANSNASDIAFTIEIEYA